MRRLSWGWAVLLVAMVNSGWAGEAQWLEVKSPHFSVVTDAGEKRGREVAVRFEQMRAVFGALMVKSNVNLPVPLQIVAFRSTKEMRPFAPLWQGKPTAVDGLFQYSDDRSFILLDMSTENPWQTVFHEYAHQLLNGNTTAQMQPWFQEGFAEFFSTCDVKGKVAEVGRAPEGDLRVLDHSGWMKVSDLFRVGQDSSTYRENSDRRSVFYAQSWLVVHYIIERQWLTKSFTYFDLVARQKLDVNDAIRQAFGIRAEEWDKELFAYFRRGWMGMATIPTPAGIETTGYSVTPLSGADAKAVLAEVHAHSADYADQAIEEFKEVLTLQPDNAAALRGLGYAYLRRHDFDEAGEYFRKAAARDAKDPRVLYYSALLRSQEKQMGDAAKVELTQKELLASIALDPNFADAYSLLAFTYQLQGQYPNAIRALSRALELNPRNDGYAYNLAEMYLANQEVERAAPILERLKNSQNRQIAMLASNSVAQVQAPKSGLEARGPGAGGGPPALERRGEASGAEGGESDGPATLVVVRFVKGKLVSVDCSAPPAATLTVAAGAKTWTMVAKDRNHLALIGADAFSCEWKNQNVAVNYRETGEGSGEVLSLELQ